MGNVDQIPCLQQRIASNFMLRADVSMMEIAYLLFVKREYIFPLGKLELVLLPDK